MLFWLLNLQKKLNHENSVIKTCISARVSSQQLKSQQGVFINISANIFCCKPTQSSKLEYTLSAVYFCVAVSLSPGVFPAPFLSLRLLQAALFLSMWILLQGFVHSLPTSPIRHSSKVNYMHHQQNWHPNLWSSYTSPPPPPPRPYYLPCVTSR